MNKCTHRQIQTHFRVGLKGSDDHGLGGRRGREERGKPFHPQIQGSFAVPFKLLLQPPVPTSPPHTPSLPSSTICAEKKYGRRRRGSPALMVVCVRRCVFACVWMDGCRSVCVIDCERIGQWEDCMWSIFMWHRFSGHVRTQQAGNDQTEEEGLIENIQREKKRRFM